MSDEKVLLGVMSQSNAQHVKNALEKQGFEIALVHNHATCNKGCSTDLELWAAKEDANEIVRTLSEQRSSEWISNGYDPSLADKVFDPDTAEATCPACGTVFSTKHTECPDCGLCF